MDETYLLRLLSGEEDYDLEFKAAKHSFGTGHARDYCAALSNENGGFLLLGINNSGVITGTAAFTGTWNKLAHKISESLRLRVKVYQVKTKHGRVLAFEIPRHPIGTPIQVYGGSGKYRYPIRDGESLKEMSPQTLREIFAEVEDDWSAEVIAGVTIGDLDQELLTAYRKMWAEQAHRLDLNALAFDQMLGDLRLASMNGVTNAAVLLFGSEALLSRVIPDAEIIFEWRNDRRDINYGERRNWRKGFIGVQNEIWAAVSSRNTVFRYQEGFIQRDIPSYDEASIREAIINAFAHRDYRITGQSVRIMVSPEEFYIENPGRLMPGVTLENILDRSVWRNRLLAESLEKVNIMERSSQGVDKIFRRAVEDGKGLPTMRITNDPTVELSIPALLEDQGFIGFLAAVAQEKQVTLSVKEIIELEHIRKGVKVKNLNYKDKFLDLGIIERIGHGRGSKYILSHQYYQHTGNMGRHAHLSGLTRDVKRTVITEYLKKHSSVTNRELQEAMPEMSPQEISMLLKGMKADGLISYHGTSPRWGSWQLSPKDS